MSIFLTSFFLQLFFAAAKIRIISFEIDVYMKFDFQ